jgi:hypothetical protein
MAEVRTASSGAVLFGFRHWIRISIVISHSLLNMQVTSLLSHQDDHHHDHAHDESCSSVATSIAPVRLWQTQLGVVFVVNAFVCRLVLFLTASAVANASAFIGAIILGYPIVITAYKDLRQGLLEHQ